MRKFRVAGPIFSDVFVFIARQQGFGIDQVTGLAVAVMDFPEGKVLVTKAILGLADVIQFNLNFDAHIDPGVADQLGQAFLIASSHFPLDRQ